MLDFSHNPAFTKSWTPLLIDALQFEVVTTDGRLRIANRCQDAELFWALRGGGGAFGVTTRVWIKSHEPLQATNSVYGDLTANSTQSYEQLVRTFIDLLPGLFEKGITGEWTTSYPRIVRPTSLSFSLDVDARRG